VDGTIRILASKGDLNISDPAGTATLAAGQETTRTESSEEQEKRNRRKRAGGVIPGAQAPILNSTTAMYGGVAIVGGVTAWVLLQGDEPVSPSKP
jgi:hypothetical protein